MAQQPTLAVRHHTRASSALYLAHAFSIFGPTISLPIISGLQNELSHLTTVTLMDLIGFPTDEIQYLEYTKDGIMQMLTRAQVRLTKNIQNWAIYEFNKNATVDFET